MLRAMSLVAGMCRLCVSLSGPCRVVAFVSVHRVPSRCIATLPSSLGAGPLPSCGSRPRPPAAPFAVSFVVADVFVRAVVAVYFVWGFRPVVSCRVVVRPRRPPVQSVPPCVSSLVCVVLLCVRWWRAVWCSVPCLRLLRVLWRGVAVPIVSLQWWS